ncbi:hypothetical protein ACFE04_006831 [Oxalis oulophora]
MAEKSISVIDLQDFPRQYENLRQAAEEWGCFRILNHKIPTSLLSEMKTVVRSFLDLPSEIKVRNTDAIAGSGYMKPSQKNPFYEALGLYMGNSKAVETFCDQLDASPHQRNVVDSYAKAIREVLIVVSKKMAASLGVKSYCDVFAEWPSQCRINKYNFTPESVGSLGVQVHTDSGFLTILQEDENVDGLEVMMRRSGEFVPVDPCPGTLLVILGDMANVWSNGRLCNVKHRVYCREATIRVSIATFLLAPKEELLEPAPELVDVEHPRLYVPFLYEDYRKLRISTKLQAGEALELMRAH